MQHSAPVPSVTSHWFPCPHNLPYSHSSQRQSNTGSCPRSVMVMFSLCVCVCVHSHVFLYFGGTVLFCVFTFPLRRRRRHEGVSLQRQREWVDRQRERRRKELSSSNRQRAKRMTVPSSSFAVNMIMFETSLRSQACHTVCKTVTKRIQQENQRAARKRMWQSICQLDG